MTAKNIFFILGLGFVLLVAEIGMAEEPNTLAEKLIVDKTVLTIDCENAPDSLYFQALLYGSSFEKSELIFQGDKFPYTLDILHGNFMGIVNTKMIEKLDLKVQVAEYKDGGLALTADRQGHRLLVRRRNNWAAVEQLN